MSHCGICHKLGHNRRRCPDEEGPPGTEFPKFKQSQSHGFIIENMVRKIFKLPFSLNDTHKYDIPSSANPFDSSENISVKASGKDTVDCGDILRMFNNDFTEKVTMIIFFYQQVNKTSKKIKKIIELNYNKALHDLLFGDVSQKALEDYVSLVKSIPPGIVTDKGYLSKKKKLQEIHHMRINISPKVDSKKQRRVQCSITKFSKLIEARPEFVISSSTDDGKGVFLRGKAIESTIKSTVRKRS